MSRPRKSRVDPRLRIPIRSSSLVAKAVSSLRKMRIPAVEFSRQHSLRRCLLQTADADDCEIVRGLFAYLGGDGTADMNRHVEFL